MARERADLSITSQTGWPALEWELIDWVLTDLDAASRTKMRAHRGPYRASVTPCIAQTTVSLDSTLLVEVEAATAGVVRFDTYVSMLFSDAHEIAPLSTVLLRSESASSSQIENLTVGVRQLALAELGESSSRNADVVTANVAAMRAATQLAERIDTDSIRHMQRVLLESSQPRHAGVWRGQQVWIGGSALGPHQAKFVPPVHQRVPAAIEDLVQFIDRDDIPILAQAAIAHAQFETIHPFVDGNGRTGRAIVHAMLRSKGLTRRVTVPISAGLLTDIDGYFEALSAYRDGDPTPIVACFADASTAAVNNGRQLVDDLAAIRANWTGQIKARTDAAAWRLRDLVLRQPVVTVPYVVEHLGVTFPAAQRAIDRLVDAGALTPATVGRARNRIWQSGQVLAVLDDFVIRTGHRQRS